MQGSFKKEQLSGAMGQALKGGMNEESQKTIVDASAASRRWPISGESRQLTT